MWLQILLVLFEKEILFYFIVYCKSLPAEYNVAKSTHPDKALLRPSTKHAARHRGQHFLQYWTLLRGPKKCSLSQEKFRKKKSNSFLPAQGLLIEIAVLQIGQTSVCRWGPLQWQKSFFQSWLMDMIYKAVARKKKLGQNGQEDINNKHNTVKKAWKYLYKITWFFFFLPYLCILMCRNENVAD